MEGECSYDVKLTVCSTPLRWYWYMLH